MISAKPLPLKPLHLLLSRKACQLLSRIPCSYSWRPLIGELNNKTRSIAVFLKKKPRILLLEYNLLISFLFCILKLFFRKNVQTISNEIKRRIEYLKETEETKARFERDQLLKLINDSVEKQVSQKDFQEKFLQNAIQQLKGIAV